MKDFKAMLAQIGRDLAEKQAAAKIAWASFQQLRSDAAAEGVDFLSNAEAFTKLDEAGKAYDGLCDEINTMQAQFNRLMELSGEGAPSAPNAGHDQDRGDTEGDGRTLSQRFLGSQAWDHIKAVSGPGRNLNFGNTPSAELCSREEVRAALMTTSSFPSTNFQRPGIIPLPQKPLTILDLVRFIPTDSETIEYTYEQVFTNAAVETAEGEAAGEGTLTFTSGTVGCKWIPFAIPSTRQLLSDEPRMEAWINERLPRGVRTRLQTQVVSGDGLGQNLTGIANWTNILTQDAGADTRADLVHKAKTKIIVATEGNYVPNVILLHPNDYERLVLTKTIVNANEYIFGGPGADGFRTIWGMLPVSHTSITEGNPLVLDIDVVEVYVREGVTIAVSDSHSDYFTKNKLMWLAQGRFANLVSQPKAVCEITDFDS